MAPHDLSGSRVNFLIKYIYTGGFCSDLSLLRAQAQYPHKKLTQSLYYIIYTWFISHMLPDYTRFIINLNVMK